MNAYIKPKQSVVEDLTTGDILQQHPSVQGSKVLQYVAASAGNINYMCPSVNINT